MRIEGNPDISDKFYIIKEDNSIKWVPTLSTAKMYVENPIYKDWFNKTIYCTNEEVVKGYDGKVYIKSNVPEKPKELIKDEQISIFKSQAKDYIHDKLETFSKKYNYDSFLEILSLNNSSLKEYKKLGKQASAYRDKLYTYINKITEDSDFSKIYFDYLTNFPEE